MLSVKFEGGISTIALLEKIREVINKRIQEKKKNEFTDLAPIDDIENGAEYLKALHWAIKKKKVKNIALAGPYGAGKSSIIDTYLKKHPEYRRIGLAFSTQCVKTIPAESHDVPVEFVVTERGILCQSNYQEIL